jgi:hypothetical protein
MHFVMRPYNFFVVDFRRSFWCVHYGWRISFTDSSPIGWMSVDFQLVQQRVQRVFEQDLSQPLREYMQRDVVFPVWMPPDSFDDAIKKFIAELKLPSLHGHPSLLLHRLGDTSFDPELSTRVANIFDNDAPMCVITFLRLCESFDFFHQLPMQYFGVW